MLHNLKMMCQTQLSAKVWFMASFQNQFQEKFQEKLNCYIKCYIMMKVCWEFNGIFLKQNYST